MRTQVEDEDEQSRVLYELYSIIVHIFKLPPLPLPFSTPYSHVAASSSSSSSSSTRHLWTTLPSSQLSPSAFASLLLGISLALMLFGSLAFVIGFVLLPWVTALVLAFYIATVVSTLSHWVVPFLVLPRCSRISTASLCLALAIWENFL